MCLSRGYGLEPGGRNVCVNLFVVCREVDKQDCGTREDANYVEEVAVNSVSSQLCYFVFAIMYYFEDGRGV